METLPDDIMKYIFLSLDPRFFAKCKRVCHKWNRLLTEDRFWYGILEGNNICKDPFIDKSLEWIYWSHQPIPTGKCINDMAVENFTGVAKIEYYQGEFVNGKPKGYGILKKNFIYYGQVDTDNDGHEMASGYGISIFETNINDGNFINGKLSGFGRVSYFESPIDLNGDLRDIFSKTYSYFEGEFIDGEATGYGTSIWDDGRTHVGLYRDSLRHGYGEYYFHDGSYYKGNWTRGCRSGFGEMYDADKQKHWKGIWEEDKKKKTPKRWDGFFRLSTKEKEDYVKSQKL